MNQPDAKKPISKRKYWAVMQNLAKARRVPRTPASYARSRHNATKHGLFARHLEGTFVRLGEDPREFRRLSALLERRFAPRDGTEKRLVRRLAEATWRHLRVYHAAAGWLESALFKRLGKAEQEVPAPASRPTARPRPEPDETHFSACEMVRALMTEKRFARRTVMTLGEIERTLRLLLIYRSGDPNFNFHFTGRKYRTEITDLSADPRNWARRYAASVPLR
jgi:hypothetical protein